MTASAEITRFHVENGRAQSRGCIVISIDWRAPDRGELVVARSEVQLLRDVDEVTRFLNPLETDYLTHDILEEEDRRDIYNVTRIGNRKHNQSFYLEDADIPEKGNIHYYAWIEIPARELAFENTQYLDYECRSAAIRKPETQEQYLKRKMQRLKTQKSFDDMMEQKGRAPKDIPTIDEIAEEIITKIKEERDLLSKVDEIVQRYDLDEETSEFFGMELLKRIDDIKKVGRAS